MRREQFSHPLKVKIDGVTKTFDMPYVITDSSFGSLLVANTNTNIVVEMTIPKVIDITDITYL